MSSVPSIPQQKAKQNPVDSLYDTLAPQLDASASHDPTDALLSRIDLEVALQKLDPMVRDIVLLDAGADMPDYYIEHDYANEMGVSTDDIARIVGMRHRGKPISASLVRKYRDRFYAECRARYGHEVPYVHTRQRTAQWGWFDDGDDYGEDSTDRAPLILEFPWFDQVNDADYAHIEQRFDAKVRRMALKYGVRSLPNGVRWSDPDLVEDLHQEGRIILVDWAWRSVLFRSNALDDVDEAEVMVQVRSRMLDFRRAELTRGLATPSRRKYRKGGEPKRTKEALERVADELELASAEA